MAEITLDRAIALLSSEKQKDRTDGLADLKHILQQNKQSTKLTTLNDKACHKIFECLFRFVTVEKWYYNRASSKGASSTRLSTCASVLRIAVDVLLRNLRTKSIRALVDHITETLPVPEEGLWEPLSVDYTKCLVTLLHYPRHIEHLSTGEWEKLMNFCLRSLGIFEDEDSQLSRNGSRSTLDDYLGVSGQSTSSRTSKVSKPTSSLAIREKHAGGSNVVGETIRCIQQLVASPSTPVQSNAERILYALTEVVTSSQGAGNGHQAAFNSINTVVTKVLFDQSDLVREFLLDLVPVIRRLWNTKLTGLKDELLGTVMFCTIIFTDAARRDPSEVLSQLIGGLVDTLYSEYTKRPEKEILQIDELVFYPKTLLHAGKAIIGPRFGNARSEHNWTLIWVISCLLELQEDITVRLSTSQAVHEMSPKKQRLNSATGDILRESFLSSGTRKICALQLTPFLLKSHIENETKTWLLERLIPDILDDNGAVSSWTMIVISSLSSSSSASSPSLYKHWHQVWDLASRASTSQTTSRAACNLMNSILQFDLLEYTVMAEKIRSILLSVNISGPSTITDSSLAIWATMTRMSAQVNPGSALNTSKQICAWLQQVWSIGTVTDRIQTAQVAAFARPLDLLNLLLACTNKDFRLPHSQFRGTTGLMSKYWHFIHSNRELLRYIFCLEGTIESADPWIPGERLLLEQTTRQDPNDAVVLELLQAKSDTFLQAWQSLSEKSHHITLDVLQILASFCITVTIYVETLPVQLASRLQDLQRNSRTLWNNICLFLANRETAFINAFLELFPPLLGSVSCFFQPNSAVSRGLQVLLPPVSEILERQRRNQNEVLSVADEAMELDDPLSNSGESLWMKDQITTSNREALPIFLDAATFQRCMTIQLSIFQKGQTTGNQPEQFIADPSLVQYLTQLDEVDLLAAHHFMPEVYYACSGMKREWLLDILEDLGGKCLQSYELERCESSHTLCVHMMTNFVSSWTQTLGDNLSESASDIYTWLTDVLLGKGKASPRVFMALSDLLGAVLSSNPVYTSDQSSPSPRTSLFKILQEGDIPVKFKAANLIPRLFGQFLLKDHDAIFDDVLDSLPRDPDWNEGIALRLYILGQLASRWHTLLRRSIYHMFETPAQVPHSLWYAEKCLKNVAKTLGLHDARQLFRLFSSQILYTWTESQSLKNMPFSVFDYANLGDMLSDVQDEIVGQIMMRANEEEAAELSSYMNISFDKLLRASFYKAEAYSIARDISTPPGKGSNSHNKSAEPRLKKLLGTDHFVELIEKQFPQVIAIFFRALDQYEQIERAFSKRPNFHGAFDTLRHITSKSSSNFTLPANQQPSFRSRYLLDELDFLCKRSGYEFETIWTPALASFVSRSLIETIHPALGSLHACSVIRKIRILVCVAGPIMLQDYPYEMMLHALRPFLTDIHCSEDSLGIFWYLLEAGSPYLAGNPGFMAGLAVSTFVSLKRLLESSPESKAQENQFMIVLAKVREFLEWFCTFLETYSSPVLGPDTKESFRGLIKSSQSIFNAASSSNGTHEHELLLEILRDQNSDQSLLSKPISDHVVSLLCADFKRLPDYRSAITSNNNDPVAGTVAVCQTLQNFNPGHEYQLWAARVIGGTFATTGRISDVLLREQEPSLFQINGASPHMAIYCHSKAKIIEALCNMLQNSSHFEVGLVERTLQLVVSNLQEYRGFEECGSVIFPSLMNALMWSPYHCPGISLSASESKRSEQSISWDSSLSCTDWARSITLWLSTTAAQNPVVGPMNKVLNVMPSLSIQLLPYILHDIFLAELDEGSNVRDTISTIFRQVLSEIEDKTIPHARLVISCILYLRNQPWPQEATIVERDGWLDIDYGQASQAACHCFLPKTSLLFMEIHASRVVSGARRSSLAKYEPPADLLHDTFKDIDDPDLYYGIHKKASLGSVMETLEYESSGFKNLLFQSAQYDSEIQMAEGANRYGVLKALNYTNLQGIANSMFPALGDSKDTSTSFDSMLQSATSLRQWDIPVSPLNISPTATVFKVFQSLNTSATLTEVSNSLDESLLSTLDLFASTNRSSMSLRTAMRVLGVITEVDDVVNARSSEDINQAWMNIKDRNSWLKTTSVHEVGEILSCHEALFSSIKKKDYLRSAISLSDSDAQLLEVNVIRRSLEISRDHSMSQSSLKSAICLSKLSELCASKGISIEGAAKFDLANVLWDQGEMTASIRMLQQLNGQSDLSKQAVPISRAELLVTLGHHVAEARLEKPEHIIQEYLAPAVKELKGRHEGDEAGRVFHGFAMFCDQQLQNPDGLEDFKRVEQIRNRKAREVAALEDMLKSAEGRDREPLKMHRMKAKQWFDLDDREYQRLKRSREAFMQQCLENYLLCLKGSDTYNNDVLRFCALWLDNSDSSIANKAVAKYLNYVPSRKFAPLMNQLTSRLLDVADDFQPLLYTLIYRICVEHPFHGMYQIFASSKSKGGKDQSGMSRNRAASKLVDDLKNDKHIGPTWVAVHNTNINYVRFAADRIDNRLKSGAKVLLKKQVTGFRLEQDAINQKLPPPTMHIDIRTNCDYNDVPRLVRYQPEFTVASGVSAPKIVTAIATNGLRYKQLFKGGNDDLRQDAIMEQVFEQVSSVLKDHQATRQRNMGIRTYKVLPLTSNAGIIEFVPHTIPLHEYSLPAHQRYYPKDMKPSACRKTISDVQTRSFEQRVRTYNQVTEQFHPILRYFFMEKYNNPDDWFSKRLAYTRSTAAISILGHVLGLGDRHGHNILLDERTGEVVHIDLGVAFEQGRVLPIPEVVPFRLTRDLVDGMGITKTEGVFRRCCEFTLEALRQYSYSIMTILDVLRYDPLYSWTVSPVRMKKMQDPQEADGGPPVLPGAAGDQRAENEPSEADRALTVVAKKLSKTLSVTATVNELIQQATDERNLAVLYCGWAAYA